MFSLCRHSIASATGFTHYSLQPIIQATDSTSSTHIIKRWATKKSGGSSKNGRDSNPKYLGVKRFGGEAFKPGVMIIRQRGKKFHPGEGVGLGKDYTIFALRPGRVRFTYDPKTKRQYVSVDSFGLAPPTIGEIRRVGLQTHRAMIEEEVEEAKKARIFRLTGGLLGRPGMTVKEESDIIASVATISI